MCNVNAGFTLANLGFRLAGKKIYLAYLQES